MSSARALNRWSMVVAVNFINCHYRRVLVFERDDEVTRRRARCEIALADDDNRVCADLFGHLCRHCGFEFAGADKLGFQLFAIQRNLMELVETASRADLQRAGCALDNERGSISMLCGVARQARIAGMGFL